MENLHQYSVYIEHTVRSLMGPNVERFALGGIINSDFIEYGGMVTAISAALATKYDDDNMKKIDAFLDDIIEYHGVNFRDIGLKKIIQINDEFRELAGELE